MTEQESINAIMELTEMNDELVEQNANLKDDLIVTLERLVEYQRKHIAELEDVSDEFCTCQLH